MISAVLIVKNEEKNIVDCIDSIGFCDEIIIVDDDSIDRTSELIQALIKNNKQIKYYKRSLENDFSKQREFGIEKAKNDWIFFIDADERINPELATEIIEKVTPSTKYGGFLIKRIDFMWGKELRHGEVGNIRLLRLFNRKEGRLKGKVHETWETKSEVGYFNNPIYHYPHPTISEFLSEINFYTDLRAQELYDKKVKIGFLRIVFYPMAKFIKNYLFKFGFLDGIAGLVHALLMSFHSFLVRGKLYLLWHQKPS